MIPHFLARPGMAEGLQFRYDFDARKTSIVQLRLTADGIEEGAVSEVDDLLRHPVAVPDGWLAATMPERKFGEPAYLERWSWDPVERVERLRIPHDKFGLMQMAASADGSRVLVDRAFRASGVENDALVLGWPQEAGGALTLRSTVHPVISGVVAAAFDEAGERLGLIHVDQGGCEVRVYRLDGAEPTLLGEFGQWQLPTDFQTGALAFVDGKVVVLVMDVTMLSVSVGVYDASGEEPGFETLVRFEREPEEEPEWEAYERILSNSNPAFLVRGGAAWVGGQGVVYRVPLDGAEATEVPVGLDVVVQIRELGGRMVALDTEGRLAPVQG